MLPLEKARILVYFLDSQLFGKDLLTKTAGILHFKKQEILAKRQKERPPRKPKESTHTVLLIMVPPCRFFSGYARPAVPRFVWMCLTTSEQTQHKGMEVLAQFKKIPDGKKQRLNSGTCVSPSVLKHSSSQAASSEANWNTGNCILRKRDACT